MAKLNRNIRNFMLILLHLNFKTIIFNFRYFQFHEAILFPVFVSFDSRIRKLKGKVIIEGPVTPGMIRMGSSYVGIFDRRHMKFIWQVEGEVVFKGSALFKYGSKVIVDKNGYLEIGNKFRISANSSIICYKRIIFGNHCRISWDVQIMDTDFHKILSLEGKQLNLPRPIEIGNHNWIGTRVTILKGAKTDDDCIVASNSLLTREIMGSHQIMAGNPAKVIKTNVTWEG